MESRMLLALSASQQGVVYKHDRDTSTLHTTCQGGDPSTPKKFLSQE